MKVLVILAAYRPSITIVEQVESIFRQDDVDVDLKIFNDGPKFTDEILLQIKNIGRKHSFEIIQCTASGSAGRNFLRALTSINFDGYDAVSLSDQDDVWMEGKLSTALHVLKLDRAMGYSCNLLKYDGEKVTGVLTKEWDSVAFDHLFQGASAGCTYVLTKSYIRHLQEHCKYSDEIVSDYFSHDWFLYFYAKSNGFEWFHDPRALIKYRLHEDNVWNGIGRLGKLKLLFCTNFIDDNHRSFLNITGRTGRPMSLIKRLSHFRPLSLRREKSYSIIAWLWLVTRGHRSKIFAYPNESF